MELFLGFALSLLLTTALVPLFMRYAVALHLVDDPSYRKVHSESVPRSGGLAIVIGVFVSLLLWIGFDTRYLMLFVATSVIVVFGVLDDAIDLGYRRKILGQTIATLILMASGVVIHQVPFMGLDTMPAWVSYPVTFLFVLGITNAVNLSDGLDGLAAGNSLLSLCFIAFLGFYIGEHTVAVLALAVVGGLLGFLRFNTHPAKVFMGDTGSQFLGFICASLAIMVTQHEAAAVSPFLLIIILGLPVLDTATVITLRALQGRFIFSPDQSHLHHQFLKLGFRHYEVVAILYAIQAVFVLTAFIMRYESDFLLLVAYSFYCLLILGFIGWGRAINWKVHTPVSLNTPRERRTWWLRKVDWYYYHGTEVIVWAVSVFLVGCALFITPSEPSIRYLSFYTALGLGLVWLLFRDYSIWSTRVICFSASAFVIYGLVKDPLYRSLLNLAVDGYLCLLAIMLMLAIRMTRRELFRLDTQDYLVLFLVMMISLIPIEEINSGLLGQITLRFAVLLYACEFLLSRKPKNSGVLNTASILSLIIIGLNT